MARARPALPIQPIVMLQRIDPEHSMARFYSLMIKRDLFGTVRLVRHWGRIGAMQGRKLAQDFASEAEAGEALERLAVAKRRRGFGICEVGDVKGPVAPSWIVKLASAAHPAGSTSALVRQRPQQQPGWSRQAS